MDKKLDALTSQFEKMKGDRKKLQDKIDNATGNGKNSEAGKLKDSLQKLRQKKGSLIDQKKAIRAQLDAIKGQADKLSKERKDTRSNAKFGSVEDIDKEMKKLQRRQETTSMSLQEEKLLIKELDALKASKASIEGLKSTEAGLDNIKDRRKAISADMNAKDKEIDAVAAQIDEAQGKLKKLSEKETEKKGGLDKLFKEKDELNKKIKATLNEKDKLRDDFREQHDKWYDYSRAIKAQRKIQYDEEKKKREEEHQEYLKKKEEEELKKPPYEEEQALCDYLAEYLERTYITKESDGPKVSAKKEEVVAVKEDPFAGFKPSNKKDDDVEYFGKGKGGKKKKRDRQANKKPATGPFTLSIDSFEQFGFLQLNPPTTIEQVPQSIKELKEKKEWYKNQPRGSVPTAAQIRKENEKAAAKLKQGNGKKGSGPAPKGKFNLSSEDFVPLGKGASADGEGSSWGQKEKPESESATAEESSSWT